MEHPEYTARRRALFIDDLLITAGIVVGSTFAVPAREPAAVEEPASPEMTRQQRRAAARRARKAR